MLLEKAHYIKYKSQVIIVNFDEKKNEYRVRMERKVMVGPKSVHIKCLLNERDF